MAGESSRWSDIVSGVEHKGTQNHRTGLRPLFCAADVDVWRFNRPLLGLLLGLQSEATAAGSLSRKLPATFPIQLYSSVQDLARFWNLISIVPPRSP